MRLALTSQSPRSDKSNHIVAGALNSERSTLRGARENSTTDHDEMAPQVQKKVLHPVRQHMDPSQYFPIIQVINIDTGTGKEIPVKGVLKGGDVPPLQKKYKRIQDAPL